MANSKKIKIIVLMIVSVIVAAAIIVGGILLSSKSNKLQKLLDTGNRYLSEEDYELAVEYFEMALEIDEKSPEAYIGLAEAYEAMGDLEKALDIADKGYEMTGASELQSKKRKLSKKLEEAIEEPSNNAEASDSAADTIEADAQAENESQNVASISEQEDRSFEVDSTGRKIIVNDDSILLDDSREAEYFRAFLRNGIPASHGNESKYLSDIVREEWTLVGEYGLEVSDEYLVDGAVNLPAYINCTYIMLPTSNGPQLFIDMSMSGGGIDHNMYQIACVNDHLVVESFSNLAWCDGMICYDTGIVELYHGQHAVAISCYYDAAEPVDQSKKSKVACITGSSDWLDDEAIEDYKNIGEELFVYITDAPDYDYDTVLKEVGVALNTDLEKSQLDMHILSFSYAAQ